MRIVFLFLSRGLHRGAAAAVRTVREPTPVAAEAKAAAGGKTPGSVENYGGSAMEKSFSQASYLGSPSPIAIFGRRHFCTVAAPNSFNFLEDGGAACTDLLTRLRELETPGDVLGAWKATNEAFPEVLDINDVFHALIRKGDWALIKSLLKAFEKMPIPRPSLLMLLAASATATGKEEEGCLMAWDHFQAHYPYSFLRNLTAYKAFKKLAGKPSDEEGTKEKEKREKFEILAKSIREDMDLQHLKDPDWVKDIIGTSTYDRSERLKP